MRGIQYIGTYIISNISNIFEANMCVGSRFVFVHELVFVFAYNKNTFVFEANMCVGSRDQQSLISSRMTDGKDNEKITEREL